MKLTAKDLDVKWDYCECGCKCNEFKCGPVYVKYFNDLKGNFYVQHASGIGLELQDHFTSEKDMKKALMDAALEVVRGMLK